MKIGVMTHYYKSTNYGGNLQSYALVRVLNNQGFDAEQISYERKSDYIFRTDIKKRSCLWNMVKKIALFFTDYNVEKRKQFILQFNQEKIPHSTIIYNINNLNSLDEKYDVFITGSDQVWHPKAVCDAYLLNFNITGKRIAYAASFSVDNLEDIVKQYYYPCLKKMDHISVREKRGIELVKSISQQEANLVLDPTLLLTENEWEDIREEIHINKKYVFCYFLGSDTRQREIVQLYAKRNNYIVVTLPYLVSKNKSDKNFGDYKLYQVSPGQLLSLIKNAQSVFTDSFHVSVFSVIYHKSFLVFDRGINSENGRMGSRIDTLLSLFHLEQCQYDMHKPSAEPREGNWEIVDDILSKEREKSFSFIEHALNT